MKRKAKTEEIKVGAVLMALSPIEGSGPVLVRVESFETRVNPRRMMAIVRPMASGGGRFAVPLDELLAPDTTDYAPRPTTVIESPDKPPTQIVYAPGISVSAVGVPAQPPPAAIMARPALFEQDSEVWKLTCMTCPLEPKGSCGEGRRVGEQHYEVLIRCEHARGLKQDGNLFFVGCGHPQLSVFEKLIVEAMQRTKASSS